VEFALAAALPILERTPAVLDTLLRGIPEPWVHRTEGPDTWSPFDVVGHLIHGERTDWIPRLQIILAAGESTPFAPFDRFAHFEATRGQTLGPLLDIFAELRAGSLDSLRALALTPADLTRRGRHPAFGPVTLGQHLASWVVHDLGHIAQIARVMAKQYTDEVGPWKAYLPVLASRTSPA
jgi:hypothetical protein